MSGPPMIDFSPLGDLANVYNKAKDQAALGQLGQGLADGTLDYKQAAGAAAQAGRLDLTMSLLDLARKKDATDSFNKMAPLLAGGGLTDAPPSVAPPGSPTSMGPPPQQVASIGPVAPPSAQPRPEVPSSSRVWGDKEAEAAGLYEPGGGASAAPSMSSGNIGAQAGLPRPRPIDAPQAQPIAAVPQSAPPAPQQGGSAPSGPPMPATSNVSRNIPLLLRMVANPGLEKPQQEAAKVLLEHALKTSDLPPDQKDYVLYRTQGGNDDFTTWLRKNKTAGATMINTAEGMDAAQTKARIAIDTHAIQDLGKKVVAGRAAIPALDRMIAIADKTPAGWAGAVSPYIAKGLASVGIEVPEGISNSELMLSLSRQFIPAVRDPGSTSNYEQGLYQSAVPSLVQSVEGRLKIASMFKSQIQRQAEIMQIYRENVGSPNLDKKLAELDAKPVFSPADRKVLEETTQTAQNGGGTSPPAAGANPYEAEMRRRGLLK